jgi:mono/diheme cytochrome c family protein
MANGSLRIPAGVKGLLCLGASLALAVSTATSQTGAQAPVTSVLDQHRALLTAYCTVCHNSKAKAGGLALDSLDLQTPGEHAQIWEKAVRKLRGRLMPPPGSRQPAQKDVDAFVAWMENTLDAQARGPKAAYVPIQRLNRTEYAASVKALVGVEVNAKDVLPQDIQVGGFDNIAAVLNMSPAFLDQYITAARHVARAAVGDPTRVANVKYGITANQEGALPLPPGTRGGIRFRHSFPADGEYRISVLDLGLGLYTGPLENESTLVIMIDGRIVFQKPVGGPEDQALADRNGAAGREQILSRFAKIPAQVQAGVRDVIVAFIDRSRVESDENIGAGFLGLGELGFGAGTDRMPRLGNGVEILGPFNATGVSRTPSRALIFVCDPKTAGESACARRITENLARRAFRRPVTSEEVDRLLAFYRFGREGGGSFDQGVEQMVAAVLSSPEFLYRSIRGAAPARGSASSGGEVALTDLEMASRLSFFLWNAGPDDELLALAAARGLTRPGALEKQVTRMMADPKAASLVTGFAMKWLDIADLDAVKPDPAIFPEFSDALRRDFSREAEAFLRSILLEDRSVLDLLTADHTFLNERLARHYGIAGVFGTQFRRVTLAQTERWGLLGKGAVLLKTSYGDRTSPVLRGAWVLDKLMATPPAPPPPNVTTNLDAAAGEKPKTIRARLEQHRANPACLQCHGVIDPPGLPLENFDAIGRWRTTDRQADNAPIDARTVLPSGVAVDGPAEFRTQLAARPSMFAQAVTERLMMYALNRELEYFDMPQVRAVVRAAAKNNYRFSAIVSQIVQTEAFRKQGPPPE